MKSLRYVTVLVLVLTLLCIASYLVAAPYAIAPFFNAIFMLALPLVLIIFLFRRLHADWRVLGFGALTFVASQILLPSFSNWTLNPILDNLGLSAESPAGSIRLAYYALVVGLSSGVIIETIRYIILSRWLDKARAWKDGLTFGAGHASLSSVIVGVYALLNVLFALTIRNGDMSQLPPDELATALAFSDTYWGLPWYEYLLPLFERGSAIVFHMSAALLVLQAFTRRNISWFLAAILLHTLYIAAAVFTSITWGAVPTQVMLSAFSLFSLWVIFALRSEEEHSTTEILED